MANTKSEKLFTEFPPVPTEKWEEVITADLKGADYERKLVWKTGEGFNVRPYYRAENLEGIKFLGSQAGEFPYVRGTHAHNRWRVHQTVSVVCPKEANAEALKILNAGVDSLGFLSLEACRKIAVGCKLGFCDACFSGEYPIPVPDEAEKNMFEMEIPLGSKE